MQETLKQKYEAAVRNLSGQRNWRKRAKIHAEIFGEPEKSKAAWKRLLFKRSCVNAKQSNIEHTIQEFDIVLPTYCSLLNKCIDYVTKNSPYGPSIDRIDSQRGYVPDNIQVISIRANILKRDATLKELINMGNWAQRRIKRG